MNKTPYFSLQVLLREFVKSLGLSYKDNGIKSENFVKLKKDLDSSCLNLVISPFRFEYFKRKFIYENLSFYINKNYAEHILDGFDEMFIEYYLDLLTAIPLDGVSFKDSQQIINQQVLASAVACVCGPMLSSIGIAPNELAKTNKTAITYLFDYISNNKEWVSYLKTLDKEQRDRIRMWGKGELPTLLSISELGDDKNKAYWFNIKQLFLTARIWDYFFFNSELCSREFLSNVNLEHISGTTVDDLVQLNQKSAERHFDLCCLYQELFGLLALRHLRSEEQKQIIITLLEKVNNYLSEYDKDNEMSYFYYWMKGRYLLHCGELDEALKMYKIAFEQVLYRNNEATQKIVKESILIASRIPTPDKAFINRLRNISGLFHFEILPAEFTHPKKKKTEVIESWEVDAYAQFFDSFFTKESFFPGAVYPDFSAVPYGVVLDDQQHKLDIKNPDKVISVGMEGGLVKRMPQLVYYAWNADEDSVDALIEAGAHVDKIAKTSNESALLMAVQAMQVNRFPIKNLSDRMFNAIAAKRHISETVNLITAKRRLTALGCAIQTGRLDIVKKVVKLGADIDQRHDVGFETPLFTCIGLLIHHKRPITAAIHAEKTKFSDLNLRSLMANNVGLVPHDKEGLIQYLREKESNATYSSIMDKIKAIEIDSILQNTSIEGFREIAKYLIDQGADVNAKHDMALKGFTPLMLAAELDEAELCEYMLNTKHKGNINDTCFDPQTNRRYTVREIAAAWQSKSVLKVFNSDS
ncbi:ankyrin repeat domain-containing protein [Photobacterium damselae]|uniref:ankyrin repeat domain-containing protein n=1 Tax=Photobacterium damselae TaxID=38293 RepID=UPI002542D801|nr:ankyrin repeat domain-containing protein [Photobacterium damselae]WIH20964.1 ankyrin repeat domain-containing protein [Photobacterium damselae]